MQCSDCVPCFLCKVMREVCASGNGAVDCDGAISGSPVHKVELEKVRLELRVYVFNEHAPLSSTFVCLCGCVGVFSIVNACRCASISCLHLHAVLVSM